MLVARGLREMQNGSDGSYDAIVVGSGFGGSFAARSLVDAGLRVVLLERGDRVERGAWNWSPAGLGTSTRYYRPDAAFRKTGRKREPVGAFQCVGGPSVFYGGVSLRFRPEDFAPDPQIAPAPLGGWPFGYAELEPFYTRAERILGVAGDDAADPHAPPRSAPFPAPGSELSPVSARIAAAAERLGLSPFRLPLAIHLDNGPGRHGRSGCIACSTCDGFACAIGAKNDLTAMLHPGLLGRGLTLRAKTAATRILERGGRVAGIETIDVGSGEAMTFHAPLVLLAAGALFSPQLVLASGLAARNAGGDNVGRYLMRHCNGSVYGVFPRLPGAGTFHKHIGINDFYFGDGVPDAPPGKLGNLQQVPTPGPAYASGQVPALLEPLAGRVLSHLTGLLAIAEDQPRYANRVGIDRNRRDALGVPAATIEHRHTPRDLAARAALMRQAKRILREAGAWFCYTHRIDTFSHAVGTLRTGDDHRTSVLDRWCRFRGVDGLYVVDGSFMPTSSGTNPSLTIAANALRVAAHIANDGDRT